MEKIMKILPVKFIFVTVFLCLFSAHHVSAAETHYDILKQLFKTSNEPITENDVEIPGYPNGRVCIEFDSERPMTEVYVAVNLYTRIIEARGPLLPRAVINKVFYRSFNLDVFIGNLFDQIVTDFSAKEIKSAWITSTNPEYRSWTITLHKKGKSLVFKRDEPYGNTTKTYYGYCFYQ